jgi:hypothetical protein
VFENQEGPSREVSQSKRKCNFVIFVLFFSFVIRSRSEVKAYTKYMMVQSSMDLFSVVEPLDSQLPSFSFNLYLFHSPPNLNLYN